MMQDVKVAVIGTELKEHVFEAVPLINYFLHEIFVIAQVKA